MTPPTATVSQFAAAVEDPASPDATPVVAVARAFAEAAQVPLVLLHHAVVGADHRAARRDLERAAAAVDPGGGVRTVLLRGERTADALVDYGRRHPGTVLVLATQARRTPGRLLWGSVAVEVARRAPGPLVLIGPSCDGATSLGELLVCVERSGDGDGSARARPIAESLGSALSLPTREVSASGPEVVAGILDHATRTPDGVLVMSTHGRRSGRRFRSGSVVVDVLARTARPVVVVGPECAAPATGG